MLFLKTLLLLVCGAGLMAPLLVACTSSLPIRAVQGQQTTRYYFLGQFRKEDVMIVGQLSISGTQGMLRLVTGSGQISQVPVQSFLQQHPRGFSFDLRLPTSQPVLVHAVTSQTAPDAVWGTMSVMSAHDHQPIDTGSWSAFLQTYYSVGNIFRTDQLAGQDLSGLLIMPQAGRVALLLAHKLRDGSVLLTGSFVRTFHQEVTPSSSVTMTVSFGKETVEFIGTVEQEDMSGVFSDPTSHEQRVWEARELPFDQKTVEHLL